MNNSARFTLTIPLAALATAGLFLGMKALITGDFKPQEKIVATQFEINPVVEDIAVLENRRKIEEYQKVETPPAPPIIKRTIGQLPSEPIVEPEGRPVLKPTLVDITSLDLGAIDKHEQPILRHTPNMPIRAEKSGHCKVKFDVTPEGSTVNVQATFCTDSIFKRATIRAVQRWKYNPKVHNGAAVTRYDLVNKVSFRLSDERGNIIPE